MTENASDLPLRLDAALVARGLCPSRSRAQSLIKAGVVRVNETVARKASANVLPGDVIELTEDPNPYVSRAALKLVAGLDHFAPDINGMTGLDLGASTGGFCEVLLDRGADRVLAIDVGHGQLSAKLSNDPRLTSYEGVNARDLAALDLPSFAIITADLSFISLTLALPPALNIAAKGCWLIALIKPQFEVGRANIGKGGIVRDARLHAQACEDIAAFLGDAGWDVKGVIDSPIEGSDGNREFLVGAVKR